MKTLHSPIRTYTNSLIVKGMTCEACEYKIKYVFGQIAGITNVTTDLPTGQVTIESEREVAFEELEEALKSYPKYSTAHPSPREGTMLPSELSEIKAPNGGLGAYYPLLLIVAFITGVSVITAFNSNPPSGVKGALHNFMTGFFLVFSFFKLLDVKAFADSFQMYDLLAVRSRIYALAYPFIELALGIACLVHFQPRLVYMTDIVIMGFGAIGVLKSVLDKRQIRCACLGTVFNLPMSTVTIIENSVMVAIGIVLLVG